MEKLFETIIDSQTGEVTTREVPAAEVAALQPTSDQLAASARAKRNDLLAASDWTQVIDAPVDQAVWATYRQALRDITSQTGFPYNVTWPVKP